MKTLGDGTRILNFMVDTLLIFGLAYLAFKTWNWYVFYWQYTPYSFGRFFFGILVIYYLFFESIFLRTPGKWISYSKVAALDGKRPSFVAILIRSVSRLIIIDLFFIPILGKPLHDYLSKTTLIEA